MQAEPPVQLPASFSLFLARHATPDRSQFDIIYHALPGPYLTDAGLLEARALGAFLQSAGTTMVLSSPFERARQTAAAVAEMTGAGVEYSADLSERQPVESEAALTERMLRAFHASAHLSALNGPVTIVSHGSPVLALLRALGLPAGMIERCRIYDNRNLIPMAGAWQVERLDGELRMRLAYVPHGKILPDLQDGLALPNPDGEWIETTDPAGE